MRSGLVIATQSPEGTADLFSDGPVVHSPLETSLCAHEFGFDLPTVGNRWVIGQGWHLLSLWVRCLD